jgi:hypothetical protein
VAPVLAAPAAFVAVREYGQRLGYALHGFEQRDRAVEDQQNWQRVVSVPLLLVKGVPGALAQTLDPYVAHWVGADGTWDDGPDTGQVLTTGSAVAVTAADLTTGQRAAVSGLEEQVATAYRTATARLGVPVPPVPPRWDGTPGLIDSGPDAGAVRDVHGGREGLRGRGGRLPALPR